MKMLIFYIKKKFLANDKSFNNFIIYAINIITIYQITKFLLPLV